MGSGMPEIGSRISLISKADIRYEGKLFAVDPDECTIALSSVRSYGTEDRKTTYPVPAQNQVYDFILFRGSDIKDIRVLTTTIPNDPAIVQLSVPPSLSENQFETETEFRMPGTGRLPNAPGPSRSQTFQNSGFKPASVFSNIEQVVNKHPVPNAASEDDSRSSTPSAQHSGTKGTDAPARTSLSSNKSDDQPGQTQRKQQTSYGNRDNKPQNQNNRYQQGGKQQYQQPQFQQQQRYPQNRYTQQEQRYPPMQRYQQRGQYQDNKYRNYNNDFRDSYGQRQYMQPLRNGQRTDNWNNNGQRTDNWNNNGQRGDSWNNNGQRSDNWNSYGQHGDSWNSYGQQRRMNNRPDHGGNQNNYQSTGYQNRRPRNTLKFEDDYDFEEANTQFEEMRSKLAKTKIDDTCKMNGDLEAKKEDSGNEVSGGEENEPEPEADNKVECYDKVKSFFDQISYEAIERSKGLTQRMDWKTERKINSETFGQVALRRNANYRGRGNSGGGYYNYHNRNPGMQNNYRSGGYNNRPQNNQRRQYNNPTSNPEESKENQEV